MGITVSMLERLTPSALDYTQTNLDAAGKWFGDADDSFSAQALTPVETGAAWSGDGQPDALTVLGINGSAMQAGILAMEAAANAVSGLRLAMERARNVVVNEIETKPPYMTIHDNGYITVERAKFDAHTDGLITDADADARLRTRRVIGALLYATAADTCYANLFDGMGAHLPTYTDVADPGALAHNRRQIQNAVSDVDVSNDLLRFWQDQRPPTLSNKDLNYLTNGPPPGITETLLTLLDVGTTLFSFIPLARGANVAVKGIRFLSRLWRAGEEVAPPPRGPEPPAPRGAEPSAPEAAPDPNRPPPGSLSYAPKKAYDIARWIGNHNKAAPPGYSGNRPYRNDPRDFDKETGELPETLPRHAPDGGPVTYREYDVNPRPRVSGQGRGQERLLIGYDENGKPVSWWYTDNHYRTIDPLDATTAGLVH